MAEVGRERFCEFDLLEWTDSRFFGYDEGLWRLVRLMVEGGREARDAIAVAIFSNFLCEHSSQ